MTVKTVKRREIMNNNKADSGKKKIIEKTIENLSENQKASICGYIILMIIYLATSVVVKMASASNVVLNIYGRFLPISAFAGVVAAISNICIIFMVVYYKKLGYITALCFLILQIPAIIYDIFRSESLAAFPGLFTDLLTILAVYMLHTNEERVRKYQARLREQAVTDMLTGLPNRFACNELIESLIKRGEKFTIVSIDLNNFKSINDTMGFDVGNEVLIELASRWNNIANSGLSSTYDFITRLAGDEFSLLIKDYHSSDDIVNTIKQYEAALSSRLTIDGCDLYISASFGYAEYPTDAKTADNLFSYADAAMAEVKKMSSGNHILHFSPDLLKMERIVEIERKLRNALQKDTIYFHLQPQFDINHKLRGFEALARINDEFGNVVSPGDFIPVAEKVGIVDKVDDAVLRKATAFFGELLKKIDTDIILSVNVSVKHLMKNGFLDELREVVESGVIPANQLEIEITESIMIDSADKALKCIDEIRKMGIKIAIDDFGTGYSSLSYLNNFPADLLKIDKSFIDRMNLSTSSKQYVSAIISMGHVMGYDVVSEGVEQQAQIDTLREIGCDFIQGFFWGKPMPPEEAEQLVMENIKEFQAIG